MTTTAPSEHIILGIDEVGRGPWAGPLVVGAVILKTNPQTSSEPDFWQHLTDSKKLTAKRRQELAPIITRDAAATGLGFVSSQELDQYGLSASLKLATRRAVKQVLATKAHFDEIIIDGTVNFLKGTPLEDRVSVLPKADLLIREVSAASIIAKVARDQYMTDLATKFPGYGFEQHVGYGTALHRQALLKLGITPEHRQSFRPIREILQKLAQNGPISPPGAPESTANFREPSTSQRGQKAEQAVMSYLSEQNHRVIAHNFKTKSYEIDLISVKNNQIFFTEVKYSQNPTTEGTPLARITPRKQAKMHFAAENFCATHPEYQKFSPILAVASVTGDNYRMNEWLTLS